MVGTIIVEQFRVNQTLVGIRNSCVIGTISGEVEGTPYVGEFKEVPHGDHHTHTK